MKVKRSVSNLDSDAEGSKSKKIFKYENRYYGGFKEKWSQIENPNTRKKYDIERKNDRGQYVPREIPFLENFSSHGYDSENSSDDTKILRTYV